MNSTKSEMRNPLKILKLATRQIVTGSCARWYVVEIRREMGLIGANTKDAKPARQASHRSIKCH